MSMMTTAGGPSRICYHKKLLPRVHAYARGTGRVSIRDLTGLWPFLADDRGDLLKEAEETFYGGGHVARPTPTPSPVPTPRYLAASKGTDTVPAMLTPGEAVLTPGAAEELGRGRIRKLNRRNPPNSRPKRRNGLIPQGIPGLQYGDPDIEPSPLPGNDLTGSSEFGPPSAIVSGGDVQRPPGAGQLGPPPNLPGWSASWPGSFLS